MLENSIHSLLENISTKYLEEKEENFKGNLMQKYLVKMPKENEYFKKTGLQIKGSRGQGKWATVPWIILYDPEISSGATSGFDLVYLFSADMKRIYLSLNQGWTNIRSLSKTRNEAKEQAQSNAAYLRENLEVDQHVNLTPLINLASSLELPLGYEYCNIWAIGYDAHHLPSNNTLVSDLSYMLKLEIALKKVIQAKTTFARKDLATLAWQRAYNLTETPVPQAFKKKSVKEKEHYTKHSSQNYLKQHEDNMVLGATGEDYVFQHEQRKLNQLGRSNLAKKVKIVSQISDSYHYDIRSFDNTGHEIQIEVKTTAFSKDTPFFMSSNEVEFSKQNSSTYQLWRLFDFKASSENNSLYIIHGNVEEQLLLTPSQYSVTPF